VANLIYIHPETEIAWLNTGGDETFTGTSLASSAGRQGDMRDFGTAPRSKSYAWRAACVFGTAPVVGARVDIYWKTSDGSYADNDDGSADAAVSAEDKLRNLHYLGAIVVDEAASGIVSVASGVLDINHREGGPVFWNDGTAHFSATASHHHFHLVPIPDEVQ